MNLSLTPYQTQAVQLLRALRGPALSCLHALHLVHPHPLGRADLVYFTGFNKDAVTKAMALLVNVYFLAARVGRYESWCLTDKGKQLQLPMFSEVLPANDARAPSEGDFSALPPSSSSSLYIDSYSLSVQTTTTTTENEGDFSALPPRVLEILDEWFDGCPRTLSHRAMRTALTRGDAIPLIEYRVIAWTLYTQCPLGASIKTRSIFIARKIENGERCPEFFDKMDRGWRSDHRAELRHLEELEAELDAARNDPEDV